MKAIKKGFFASWPGLNEKAVNQHFPESEEMQRSTKVKMPEQGITNHDLESDSEEDGDENSEKPEIRPRKKHRDIFVRVIDLQDELQEKI